MSQLTTNTTTIDECIALANSLPDAGSGGSGGGTCTIEIIMGTGEAGSVYALTYETADGIQYTGNAGANSQYTLTNVRCGSSVSLIYAPVYGCSVTVTDIELVARYNDNPVGLLGYSLVFRAPNTDGASGVVTIVDED